MMTPYTAPAGTPTTVVAETETLTLRRPEARDWPVFRDFMFSDRSDFVRPDNMDEQVAWRGFGHVIGMWTLRGFGLCAVCLKGSDQAIAGIGGWHPINWPEKEIGWSVWDAASEGKGIASEAAAAFRKYAYETLGWTTAVSYIEAENQPSARLAERLGCVVDKDAVQPPGGPCLVYRHPAPADLMTEAAQ